MDRRNFLRISGLASLVLSTSNCLFAAQEKEKEHSYNYHLIEEGLTQHYKDYVDYIFPFSQTVRENIKEKGKQKVIKDYVQLHRYCLDVAEKYEGKDFDKIPKDEIIGLGKILTEHQGKTSNIPLNYGSDILVETYREWGSKRVWFFKKLLEQDEKVDSYDELVRNVFSKQEYTNHIKEENISRDKVYEAFKKSFNLEANVYNALSRGEATKRVNTVKEKEKAYFVDTIDKIYGQEQENNKD
jgi:hypothetical protein